MAHAPAGYHAGMAGGSRNGAKRGPLETVVPTVVAGAAVVAGLARGAKERRDEKAAHHGPADTDAEVAARAEDESDEQPSFLDKVAGRLPFLQVPVAVQKRFGELKGNNLAAAVTLQAFLSLFPLLLVIVAAVGFVAGGGTDVAGKVVANLGLSGDASTAVRDAVDAAQRSKRTASIIGLAGLLWSGLGLVNALQYAYDQVWQVEDRGMKDKAVGLLWLGGAALLFVASAAVTTVLRWLPDVLSPLGVLVGFAVSFALWVWTAKILPNRKATFRMILPGAILGAVGLEVLKAVGAFYVPRLVASSSQLYGSIGIVFAILAWLLLFSRLLVYTATLNVVLHERRAGTVRAVVEVPQGVTEDSTPEVNRSGRVEEEDAATSSAGR